MVSKAGIKQDKRLLIPLIIIIVCSIILGVKNFAIGPQEVQDNFVVTASPVAASKTDQYKTEISDLGVTEFTNHGIYGTTESSIIYYATLTLNLKINAFSTFDIKHLDSDSNIYYKDVTMNWASIWAFEEKTNSDTHSSYYPAVKFHDFQFDYIYTKLTGIQLDVKYSGLEDRVLTFDNNNISAEIPKTECLFEKIISQGYHTGNIGEYNDVWENEQTEIKLTSEDVSSDKLPSLGDSTGDVLQQVLQMNLGVTTGLITEESYQKGEVSGLSYGAAISLNSYESLSKSIPTLIKPAVKKYNQQINVRSATFWVDTKDTLFSPAKIDYQSLASTSTYQRCAGIHVENYYVQQDLNIQCKLFSNLVLDVPLTQTFLNDPEIQSGDFIWDLSITGDTGIDIAITSEPPFYEAFLDGIKQMFGDFFNFFITIVIFIALIMISIKLLPLLPKATGAIAKGIKNKV